MEKLLNFFRAYDHAWKCGAAVSCDYSYDNYSSTDWDWWTIIPGKTYFNVSLDGITVHNTFYPWGICSNSFSVCPIISPNHLGCPIATFNTNKLSINTF